MKRPQFDAEQSHRILRKKRIEIDQSDACSAQVAPPLGCFRRIYKARIGHLSYFPTLLATTSCGVVLVRDRQRWRVRNRLPASQPVERLPANSWRQRLLARAHPPPVASRSHIVTGPARSLFVRSVATRKVPSCSSASCPSSVSSARLRRTSRRICASRVRQ
jgi:hypothetical protein